MSGLADLSLPEVAAMVQSRLEAAGIHTVLSGGSCVTAYSDNSYVSDDIDLIREGHHTRQAIVQVMRELGFRQRDRYFVHPETRFLVEFPPGPLAVGEERPARIDSLRLSTGTLRLLSPTDCVKDRLTWWLHDRDRQCLEQAILVAEAHPVDREELRRWARGEGRMDEFAAFERSIDGG